MRTPQELLSLISGAWVLINSSTIDSNGTLIPGRNRPDSSQGTNGTGVIIYHPSSFVSAQLIPTNPSFRPHNLTYNNFTGTTDAEWAIIGKHNLAYSGPLTVVPLANGTEDDGMLTHGPLTASNIPSLEGTELKRNVTLFEGGKVMRLSMLDTTVEGAKGRLYWRRMG